MIVQFSEIEDYHDQQLVGSFLFIAGSDLFNPLNQPSQHLPFHLAPHLNQLDLVGYKRFYDGPPVSAWNRIKAGVINLLNHRVQISEEDNIRKIALRRIRLPGFLDPLLQDLWLYLILKKHLKSYYDVAIVDGPESATLATILKKTRRVKTLIYYDIDYYPGVHPQWAWILSQREKHLCHLADATASVSRPLAELRKQQGSRLAIVISNGVEFERFSSEMKEKKENPHTLIYTGSLDPRWGVDLSIQALPQIIAKYPDVQLIIAGRGSAEGELRELAKSLHVNDRVHFKGFVPYAELPALLAQADIGIATSRQSSFRHFASPLKLVEYMSVGLPVICSGGGEAEQMVVESGAGINILFDRDAFTDAVFVWLGNKNNYQAARERAVQYACGRSWKQMGKKMAQLVRQLLQNERSDQQVEGLQVRTEE